MTTGRINQITCFETVKTLGKKPPEQKLNGRKPAVDASASDLRTRRHRNANLVPETLNGAKTVRQPTKLSLSELR